MECPKCGFALAAGSAECPRCGVIVAKYLRAHEEALESGGAASPLPHARTADATEAEDDGTASGEVVARAVALPAALIFARMAVKGSPGPVRLLTMWVHESGHALTAWLCGYVAFPGAWVTPVGAERSPSFSVLLVAVAAYGGYRAWQLQRWFWVVASASMLMTLIFCTLIVRPAQAQQLIVFGGDGGCLVLGTMLMLTVYARRDHPIRQNHVRWGLLVIGALALMDVYTVWSGPIDRLPFGDNENGLSDPSVLTEMYGWSVLTLINRYGEVARACFTILATVYATALGAAVASRSSRRGRTVLVASNV